MPNRVVVGSQWGDEGKAKVIDFLTESADVVIRFQGGANAGHTVEVGEEKFIFHLIPSGIMRPGTECVIGNGVVLDPEQLLKEVEEVRSKGFEVDGRLFIAENAQIVMPYHKLLDQLSEKAAGKNAIGTTGRGIGPAYYDKVARSGVRVIDLMDSQALKERLQDLLAKKNEELKHLGGPVLSLNEIHAEYVQWGIKLKPFVRDVAVLLHERMKKGKRLLFEGAQGTILDVDHGTYPFVTSSNTVAGAACNGSGVGPTAIHQVIGVVKAYTTRVGNGPFPTEIGGAIGESIRTIGNEYGATTGRDRRCGWFDAVVVRRAVIVNGLTHLAITKMDVLDDFEQIQICTGYEIDGKVTREFPSQIPVLERAKPIYETLPGWRSSLKGITSFEALPANAKLYLHRLSELVETPVGLISLGPKRHQTIKMGLL